MTQFFLNLDEVGILVIVSSHVDATVKYLPVDLVIGHLHLPVHHAVASAVAVADRVAGWQELAVSAQIDTEEGIRFVLGATIGGDPTDEIVNLTLAN